MLKRIVLPVIFLLLFIPFRSLAVRQGNSEIFVSAGYFSYDEFKGLFDAWNSYADPFAWPDKQTGAIFVYYQYFVTDNIGIGFAAGYDNQQGTLSTGDERSTGHTPQNIGRYDRRATTFAPEIFYKYYGWKGGMVYGTAGIGYTSLKTYYNYDPGTVSYYGNAYKSYSEDKSHWNAHITYFGIRLGTTIAWNLEFGFGYKGMISTGLSLKI